jgi:hypothetical protein
MPSASGDSLGVTTIAVTPDSDIMLVEPSPWDYREVAPAVTLTIAGDPVDDPFGAYIYSPPDRPEDILTPAMARELYQAGLVSGAWDMAPGTSRWIIPNYESYAPVDSMRVASPGWYGCSWDGSTGVTFPTQSAILDLVDISATFPSRINVSYGWVVDGNPEVHFSVTNTSEYSLPGFYGQPSSALYLVKDGRVVAEAWPQSMYPYGGDVVYDTVSTDSTTDASEYWGTLSPNATITGDYLWRDINGCWTDSGSRSVTAGTYSLVTAQTIYIENSNGSYPILYSGTDDALAGDSSTGVAEPGLAPGPQDTEKVVDPTIDPYFTYDWVELQVWTSLGTVTITTS